MRNRHSFGVFSLLIFTTIFFAYLNTFVGADDQAILSTASPDQLQQEKRLSDAIASINGLEASLSNARKKIDLASSAFTGQAQLDEEAAKASLYSLFDQLISFLDVFKENYSYGLGLYEQNNAQAGQQFGSPNGR